mmetsp:Transcript_27765/g.63985  ORF Transcript_27765/g.63985 Transcript_27765/m.63985 type:complete len:187 (-) Transcript_27765:12-572(-)
MSVEVESAINVVRVERAACDSEPQLEHQESNFAEPHPVIGQARIAEAPLEDSPSGPTSRSARKKSRRQKKAAKKTRQFLDPFGAVSFGDPGEPYHPTELLEALPHHMQHKAKLAYKRESKRCHGALHSVSDELGSSEDEGTWEEYGAEFTGDSQDVVAGKHAETLGHHLDLLHSLLPVTLDDSGPF